jgi:hypothetical protein
MTFPEGNSEELGVAPMGRSEGTFGKSADLLKQSFAVLREDTHLLVFPLLSGVACLAVLMTFAVPFVTTGVFEALASGRGKSELRLTLHGVWWAVFFAYYLVNYFVILFFNSALVSCALERFNGGSPTVGGGIKAAGMLLPQILAWAFVSATVGVVLRALQERAGFLGKILTGLAGMAWAIATYFVVPVLVVEKQGPVGAVKRSVEILRTNWGESLVSNMGLGLINFLLYAACAVPLVFGVALTIWAQNPIPAIAGSAITVMLVLLVSLVSSAMRTILIAALYRFAVTGNAPEGFEAESLRGAFRTK